MLRSILHCKYVNNRVSFQFRISPAFVNYYSYSERACTGLSTRYPCEKRWMSQSSGKMPTTYPQWSLEEDHTLLENGHKKSIPELAAMLGRGLRGVETRLSTLKDTDSPAFAHSTSHKSKQRVISNDQVKKKMIPAGEVLRRLRWDPSLLLSDFLVGYYDDDDLLEYPLDKPNGGSADDDEGENLMALSIPEHRILFIKYKQRILWDLNNRVDLFSGPQGLETIQDVIANYEEWRKQEEIKEERFHQLLHDVSSKLEDLLGIRRSSELNEMSLVLLEKFRETDLIRQKDIEQYVETALELFREARSDKESGTPSTVDYLETFSQLVALQPHSDFRKVVLSEIARHMNLRHNGNKTLSFSTKINKATQMQRLPEIPIRDLQETFVRGSGAGGQKINKTNNKVVLLHVPTRLRVECQTTRSLQQNRKIAYQKLRQKLDDFINGSQSIANQKRQRVSLKTHKAKARNKARRLQKKKNDSDPNKTKT